MVKMIFHYQHSTQNILQKLIFTAVACLSLPDCWTTIAFVGRLVDCDNKTTNKFGVDTVGPPVVATPLTLAPCYVNVGFGNGHYWMEHFSCAIFWALATCASAIAFASGTVIHRTGWPIWTVTTSCWLRYGLFCHPAWAVGSYSSGPSAAGTVRTKSTKTGQTVVMYTVYLTIFRW